MVAPTESGSSRTSERTRDLFADGGRLRRHLGPRLPDESALLDAERRRSGGRVVDDASVATEIDDVGGRSVGRCRHPPAARSVVGVEDGRGASAVLRRVRTAHRPPPPPPPTHRRAIRAHIASVM